MCRGCRAGWELCLPAELPENPVKVEVRRLPEREKLVLTLYYDEGLTLAEIGTVLGVTESRVSQIHTKAVLHLRSRLSATGVA